MSVEEKLNEIFHSTYGVKKCEDCTIREGWYPTKFLCEICLTRIKPSRDETSKRT